MIVESCSFRSVIEDVVRFSIYPFIQADGVRRLAKYPKISQVRGGVTPHNPAHGPHSRNMMSLSWSSRDAKVVN